MADDLPRPSEAAPSGKSGLGAHHMCGEGISFLLYVVGYSGKIIVKS
jgi:hypothetical protein